MSAFVSQQQLRTYGGLESHLIDWRSQEYYLVSEAGLTGSSIRDSPETLCCVLEKDNVFCLILVQARKTENHPDMTEKLLTGT